MNLLFSSMGIGLGGSAWHGGRAGSPWTLDGTYALRRSLAFLSLSLPPGRLF